MENNQSYLKSTKCAEESANTISNLNLVSLESPKELISL